tara:strand:- start:10 stop:264 length:255 start_codon:yes stop_codon:yes gene_type:complete
MDGDRESERGRGVGGDERTRGSRERGRVDGDEWVVERERRGVDRGRGDEGERGADEEEEEDAGDAGARGEPRGARGWETTRTGE